MILVCCKKRRHKRMWRFSRNSFAGLPLASCHVVPDWKSITVCIVIHCRKHQMQRSKKKGRHEARTRMRGANYNGNSNWLRICRLTALRGPSANMRADLFSVCSLTATPAETHQKLVEIVSSDFDDARLERVVARPCSRQCGRSLESHTESAERHIMHQLESRTFARLALTSS